MVTKVRAAELAAPAREVESMIPGVAGRLQRIAADLDALRAECAVILPVTGQAAKGYKEVEEAEEEPVPHEPAQGPVVGGRRQEAARLLGWGRNTLTRKLKELDIAL